MKAVPIDVMRDTRMKAAILRQRAKNRIRDAEKLQAEAAIENEIASDLESMADKWVQAFPETKDTR